MIGEYCYGTKKRCNIDNFEGIQLDSGRGISHQLFLSWLSRCQMPFGMKRTKTENLNKCCILTRLGRFKVWWWVGWRSGQLTSVATLAETQRNHNSRLRPVPKYPKFQATQEYRTIPVISGVSQKTHNPSIFRGYCLPVMSAGADSPLVPVWCFLSSLPSAWGQTRFGHSKYPQPPLHTWAQINIYQRGIFCPCHSRSLS